MPQLHKRVTGDSNSQKMKSSFFDCFYVMQPLTNGGHYTSFILDSGIYTGFSLFSTENPGIFSGPKRKSIKKYTLLKALLFFFSLVIAIFHKMQYNFSMSIIRG